MEAYFVEVSLMMALDALILYIGLLSCFLAISALYYLGNSDCQAKEADRYGPISRLLPYMKS